MTKDQQLKKEDIALTNQMDKEASSRNFTPVVGMQPKTILGNGYKGIIEYVGKDYFILRCLRTCKPILIQPYQYHNFENYILQDSSNLNPVFEDILNKFKK